MLRSLTVVLMLLLGSAPPAAAQKADSASEQALRPSVEAICREWEAAIAKQDPTAVGALFTADGIFVTPVGVLRDRQQIKTYYEGAFKQGWKTKSSPWTRRIWPGTLRGRSGSTLCPAKGQARCSTGLAAGAWFSSATAMVGKSAF